MSTKTLYLTLLTVAMMTGAGAANAAKSVSVADSVRLQMRSASANINADIRANVKAETRQLDVPGVDVGQVRVVEHDAAKAKPVAPPQAARETADTGMDADAVRRDLAGKALAAPGLFGVYRYMATSANNVAFIIAE